MKKKFLAILLALSMLLSLCPLAMAAEDSQEENSGDSEVRKTSFFTPQDHADVDYSDMKYEHIDIEPVMKEIEAVKALVGDKANAAEVEKRHDALTDEYMKLQQMYDLIYIRTTRDVTDEEAANELVYLIDAMNDVGDSLTLLEQAILKSPCDAFLREVMSEEEIAECLEYTAMTEEEKQMYTRETELTNEYSALAAKEYSYEIDGVEYTDSDAYEAYSQGEITVDQYYEIYTGNAKAQNADAGPIYLELVELRQKMVENEGYDNYAEYAYAEIFSREYSPEDVKEFEKAVKENIPQLSSKVQTIYYSLDSELVNGDYTGDTALDMIQPYIGRMSSEMAEAFKYMRDYHLYDSEFGDYKDGSGYTTNIPVYNAPFFFNSPTGSLYDFTTAVHEFGHYNNFFWQDNGWYSEYKDYDTLEVHSQGLELLFSHWYPDLFGDAGQDVLDYQIFNLLYAFIDGCCVDELEQYVYTSGEELTLEKINQKYFECSKAYGLVDESSPLAEYYSYYWSVIPHCFNSPCYYISYATSVSGAFSFWLDAQDDYFATVDKYLQFTALDGSYSFEDAFAAVDMDSPLSAKYVKELAASLDSALDLDARVAEIEAQQQEAQESAAALTDVPEDAWYAAYVVPLVALGAIAPQDDGSFGPEAPATHGDVVKLLNLLGAELDGEDDTDPITRLELCQLLSEVLGLEEIEGDSVFSDTNDPAVTSLVVLGAVTGYGDGSFRPDSTVTRAELCAIIFRLAAAVAE